jgi:hypothetical protein
LFTSGVNLCAASIPLEVPDEASGQRKTN